MQSELKSLSKIFSEVIFRIPDYQRGYSWEEKHLKDFWNDIEQLPDNKSHYTGVLTLEPVTADNYSRWDDDTWIIESKHYSPMYVVDGQQRLTTAVIFLQCILERFGEEELLNYTEKDEIRKKYIYESKDKGISRSYLFGYEKDNPSYQYLKQNIFCEQSIDHSTNEETIYTKNLAFAKNYFSERLSTLNKKEIEKVYTKLTQHLQFNIFYIEKDLDVFITFETMNNRGKPLSHLELLKNRLIYLSTKFEADKTEREHLRKAINESWKSVYHHLGMMEIRRFNDDDFLRTHYIFYFGPHTSGKRHSSLEKTFWTNVQYQGRYKDHLLDEVFTPKRLIDEKNKLEITDVFEYSKSMKALVKTYFEAANPDATKLTAPEISKLHQINRQHNNGLFLHAVAALSTPEKTENRLRLLTSLERFGFISKILGYPMSDYPYIGEAIGTYTKEVSFNDASDAFDATSEKMTKSHDFSENTRSMGKNAKNGFYGWALIRYFMFEYEEELKRRSKTSRQLLTWSKSPSVEIFNRDHKTVEHIYPQQAKDLYWQQQFQNYTVKERNTLRNSLGNLLPVSHSKNSSLSNKNFEIKKGSEQNQVGYKYGCLSEIQVSMSENWGAVEIARRGIYLLEFMESRWSIKIGDTAKKIRLLNLQFVLERENITIQDLTGAPDKIPKTMINAVEKRDDVLDF